MTATEALEYDHLAASIAFEYARKFRRYGVDTQDVLQELRIWTFRHPNKISEWAESEGGAEKPLARTLRHEALAYCQQQKAEVLGYRVSDLHYYSRKELQKVLLPSMFDRESWVEPPVSDDNGRRAGDPATGGNWVAILADVARAFIQLSESDQSLLKMFHLDGMTNVLVADMLSVTPQAASKAHHKALGRLLDVLGGERPQSTHDDVDGCECEDWVGTRRVVSNAAARAMTEGQYDED